MATVAAPQGQPEQRDARPELRSNAPLGLKILTGITLALLGVAAYMAFIYAPTELTMGAVQRIFYFHVGSAWAGALAFLVTAVCGVVYLITRDFAWDRAGTSAVEVGLVLLTMTLTSGPVWAQYVWGRPWTWDPKLTSAAIMWLAYAAYLMLRQGIDDPTRRARFASVYGLIAFASVIMTYFGVRLINATIHPVVVGPAVGVSETDMGMTPRMLQTMMFSFFTFTWVFATLFWYRLRIGTLASHVEALKARVLYR